MSRANHPLRAGDIRKPVQALTLELPLPISTNALWMPVRRGHAAALIRTPEYKAWIMHAGLQLNMQAKERIIGPFAVTVFVSRDSKLDLDNCLKSCLDLLQANGVIENDKHCTRIVAEKADVPGMVVQLFASK